MAQPQVGSSSALDGMGTSAVAYGYVMSGTAITACTAVSIVTTAIYATNIFSGAKYQTVNAFLSSSGSTAVTATAGGAVTTMAGYGANTLYTPTGATLGIFGAGTAN
jgi:hypothetical protein